MIPKLQNWYLVRQWEVSQNNAVVVQVEDRSNQIANFFISSGYHKGDSVALFMVNCPEYVVVWLGLAKAGVVSALINYNLKSQGLVHTIRVANCRGVVYGCDLESRKAHFYFKHSPLIVECHILG